MIAKAALASIARAGSTVFIAVVGVLPLVQPEYDARTQFMSELALGPHGEFMFVAFAALASALFANARLLQERGIPTLIPALLSSAGSCLLGAGFVTLADSIAIHVGLVAVAFLTSAFAMGLLPILQARRAAPAHRALHWGAGLAMAGATALGGEHLPVGIAQRISALALIVWLLALTRASER